MIFPPSSFLLSTISWSISKKSLLLYIRYTLTHFDVTSIFHTYENRKRLKVLSRYRRLTLDPKIKKIVNVTLKIFDITNFVLNYFTKKVIGLQLRCSKI